MNTSVIASDAYRFDSPQFIQMARVLTERQPMSLHWIANHESRRW